MSLIALRLRYHHHGSGKTKAVYRVKAAGYTPPKEGEVGFKKIKNKLISMLKGKNVELKNFRDIDYDCLVCDVYIERKNLADHFLNYRD